MHAGKILLSLSLREKEESVAKHFRAPQTNGNNEISKEFEGQCTLSHEVFHSKAPYLKISEGKQLIKSVATHLEKIFNKNEEIPWCGDSSELSVTPTEYDDCVEESHPNLNFEEAMLMMQSRGDELEMPENLQGGVVLDQVYMISPYDLNMFLFAPGSQFRRGLAELQGTTDFEEGPWGWKSGDGPPLTRVVSYIKAATKFVKAVKATEQQTYIRAKGEEFAVLIYVSTPDVPYGNTFSLELLYKMIPGPELSSGEETCRLIISWGITFHQSTMMKGMIEGGVRQGMKESYDQFASLLAQNIKVVDPKEVLGKDQVLATLETEHQSDLELACEYFCNFTVASAILVALYVLVHILLCEPSRVQGLEFYGLELPDSLGEVVSGGILVILLERVYNMVSLFIEARLRRGKILDSSDLPFSLIVCLFFPGISNPNNLA